MSKLLMRCAGCGLQVYPKASDIGLAICRSLMAAYEMLRLGYTNISVLKGGFSDWKRNER